MKDNNARIRDGGDSSRKKTGIELKLVGEDGNAFSIIGRARRALRANGKADCIDQFTRDATSGDYAHLLVVCKEWFNIK